MEWAKSALSYTVSGSSDGVITTQASWALTHSGSRVLTWVTNRMCLLLTPHLNLTAIHFLTLQGNCFDLVYVKCVHRAKHVWARLTEDIEKALALLPENNKTDILSACKRYLKAKVLSSVLASTVQPRGTMAASPQSFSEEKELYLPKDQPSPCLPQPPPVSTPRRGTAWRSLAI